MKKALVGLTLLTSLSSFATDFSLEGNWKFNEGTRSELQLSYNHDGSLRLVEPNQDEVGVYTCKEYLLQNSSDKYSTLLTCHGKYFGKSGILDSQKMLNIEVAKEVIQENDSISLKVDGDGDDYINGTRY